MEVPFVDLKQQYQTLKSEIDRNFQEICTSASFVLGPHVDQFENSFADFLGVNHAVGVASATDALYISFVALGIGPGDEVIVPANTFVATAVAVLRCGARPILVDMDADTYLIDTKRIESSITPKTKAICPVHFYGRACNMDEIMGVAKKYSLSVVEDAAQAAGARWKEKRVGAYGDFGCFSFYPAKNLGAYGDGGAISTSSESLCKKIKRIRNYGAEDKYKYPDSGINSRLDSIQASVLNVKLKYLDDYNKRRWKIAKKYIAQLESLEKKGIIKLPDAATEDEHVFHLFVIQVEGRDKIREYLRNHRIQTGLHYPIPFYLEDGYKDIGYSKGAFPITESTCNKILSLPVFPELNDAQIDYVIDSFKKYFN